MRKYLKSSFIVIITIVVLLQFFRPEKNNSGNNAQDISIRYAVPAPVQNILKVSCYDCHSNQTVYPWYANVQPIAWWLADHIKEGKEELNFNEFSAYRIGRQYRKLEEIIEEVEEDEMPLTSYTLIHRNAKLNDEQKTELLKWARGLRNQIQLTYPADSLIRPKKRKR